MTTQTITRKPSESPARTAPDLPTIAPRADAWEREEAAYLAVELPGVTAAGLGLQVEQDRLVLTAAADPGAAEGRLLHSEWQPRRYQRTFLLTEDADREHIEAQLTQGLLMIKIPRRPERRPRSIPVSVSGD